MVAHRDPRLIHHLEHASKAIALPSDKPALTVAFITKAQLARGRGVNAHLLFDRDRRHIVVIT
jgi:hypothetical protein